ncbi:MAG: lysylphosphatidylglycerol synthase transmembrane domain-containing protein [Acidimicrobiia bacterium]
MQRIGKALLSAALVTAIFVGVLPRIASFSEITDAIGAMTLIEIVLLVAVALWSLTTYGPVLMASLPGLTFGQSMVVTQSSTAIANTVPAGGAVGVGVTFAMYNSWGFHRAASTLSVAVSGVWNIFGKLGLPVAALGLVALVGTAGGGLITAAIAGVAALVGAIGLFAAVLRSNRLARMIGDGLAAVASRMLGWIRRRPVGDWGEAAVRFRHDTMGLVRARWMRLSITTVVSQLSLYVVLLLTLRNLGVSDDQVGWAEVLAAFAFVRLLSALPITPGGLGVVELGLTAALVAAGGHRAQVVAAVLVYRALTYLAPVPLGMATYMIWRRNGRRRPIAPEPA